MQLTKCLTLLDCYLIVDKYKILNELRPAYANYYGLSRHVD